MYVTEKQRIAQGERLRGFRNSLELTQGQLSDLLEMQQGSYSDIERGKSGISNQFALILLNKTDLSIDWLLTGEGEMLRSGGKEYSSDIDEIHILKEKVDSIEIFLKENFKNFNDGSK